MRDRLRPLIDLYRQEPAAARVTDLARTVWRADDPLHTSVLAGAESTVQVPVAAHTALGGDGDAPSPGDLLCAALASDLDTSLRRVADQMHLRLRALSVTVRAEVDVRGALLVNAAVPVGFQRLALHVELELEPEDEPHRAQLLEVARRSCAVLSTLRDGAAIELIHNPKTPKEVPHVA